MSRYNGRRSSGRSRGTSPTAFLVALVVLFLTVLLVCITLKKDAVDKKEQASPTEPTDGTASTATELSSGTDAPTPVARIEVFGDTEQYSSVFRVGNTGYEMYTYSDETAKKYAVCVNQAAEGLQGTARVFALCPPLSSGITLPDDLYGMNIFSDQKEAEKKILSYLGENVVGIPLNETLMQRRTEYICYRTDHHWTGLGAYYAYTQLCAAAGLTPHELTDYKSVDFPGFLGSFYNDSGKSPALSADPDTVTAYEPVSEGVTMSVTDKNGSVFEFESPIYDETDAPAAYKYGAFIYGDNPYTVIRNASLTDGSSCVVVKDSFGNALAPLLTDHYQTVHVIDYRHWTGNLTEFVKTNGVKDVIFCNNLSSIRNNSLMGQLYGIIK